MILQEENWFCGAQCDRVTGQLATVSVHDRTVVCTSLGLQGSTSNRRVSLSVQVKQSKGSWPQIIHLSSPPQYPVSSKELFLQQSSLSVHLSSIHWQRREVWILFSIALFPVCLHTGTYIISFFTVFDSSAHIYAYFTSIFCQ